MRFSRVVAGVQGDAYNLSTEARILVELNLLGTCNAPLPWIFNPFHRMMRAFGIGVRLCQIGFKVPIATWRATN